ncbi:hypothetical protein N7G274_005234 [Stereocaulon virgatum]|uniref:Uncharacterized protein n=1 Tax=Stereocaulon virgatum TaxID=373712 RepID=A0ABR4AAZ1_9LECA
MSSSRLMGAAKCLGKAVVFVPSVVGANVGAAVGLEKIGLPEGKDLKTVPEADDVREDSNPGPRAWDLGYVL